MMDRMNRCEEAAIEDVADGYDFVVRNKDVNLDTPIFRYLPVERYLEMIEDGVNVLSHLSLWEDPYEAFILRAGVTYKNGATKEDVYEVFKSVYGQSWTLFDKESDVIWRAMGSRGDVVRIRTTVRKLADSLRCSKEVKIGDNVRIAPVEYLNGTRFNSKLVASKLDVAVNGAVSDKMDFFFVKRKEFSLEKEVRVVAIPEEYQLDRESCTKGHLLKFHIDPAELIEEVLTDPEMNRRKYEQLVCRTRHVNNQIKVSRSTLFDWPTIREGGVKRQRIQDVDITDLPDGDRFRDYLIREGMTDGNAYSIWSRVRRVFRVAPHGRDHVSESELQSMLDHIDHFVPNAGSANDCRSAIRYYWRALYGHDDRGE